MTWLHHWWVNIGLNNDCQATSHYLDQCLAKFVCHYLGANEIYSQTVAEPTDFSLVVCMAPNIIFRKQRYSGRRRSYIRRVSVGSLSHQRWSGVFVVRVIALHWPRLGAPVSLLCFADHAVKQSVTARAWPGTWLPLLRAQAPLTPGQPLQHGEVKDTNLPWVRPVAASATHGSQWHKTMLGQSHHGINSYKGRHKQRNRSKRFPIYRLRRLTRLHRNRRRHTQ